VQFFGRCGDSIGVERHWKSLFARGSAQGLVLRLAAVLELIRTELAGLKKNHKVLNVTP